MPPKATEKKSPTPTPQETKFNPKLYLKPGVKEEEIVGLKEAFDIFDADKSGSIDIQEFKNAITALGLEKSSEKLLNLLSDLDANADNLIDFEEFLKLLGVYSKGIDDEDTLQVLYTEKFAKSNGKISVEDFKRIAEEIGDSYSDDELKDMIQYADLDKDGHINWEEFRAVVLKEAE